MSVASDYHAFGGINDFFCAVGDQLGGDDCTGDDCIAKVCEVITKSDCKSDVRFGSGRAVHEHDAVYGIGKEGTGSSDECDVYSVTRALVQYSDSLTLRQTTGPFTRLPPVARQDLSCFFNGDKTQQQLGLVLFFLALASDVGDRDSVFCERVCALIEGDKGKTDIATTASATYRKLVHLWGRIAVVVLCDLPHLTYLVGSLACVASPGFASAMSGESILYGNKWRRFDVCDEQWPVLRSDYLEWLDALVLLTRSGTRTSVGFVPLAFHDNAADLVGILFYGRRGAISVEAMLLCDETCGDVTTRIRACLLRVSMKTQYLRVYALQNATIRRVLDTPWFRQTCDRIGAYAATLEWVSVASRLSNQV